MAHEWVTGYGLYPMASELENCRTLVEVTENEVQNSVHSVPKLDTLIMVKAMIKNHSFSNPFNPATTASSASTGSTASKTKIFLLHHEIPDLFVPCLTFVASL